MSELSEHLRQRISKRREASETVGSKYTGYFIGFGLGTVTWNALEVINSGHVHHPTIATLGVSSLLYGVQNRRISSLWEARTEQLEDQLYTHESNLEAAAIQAHTVEYQPYDWAQDEAVAIKQAEPQPVTQT